MKVKINFKINHIKIKTKQILDSKRFKQSHRWLTESLGTGGLLLKLNISCR